MAQSTGFALAREWIIGIVLAFIIPMTTYYSVEVFYTYVKQMPQIEYSRYPRTEQERVDYREKREARDNAFEKTLFYVALIVGLVAIILGNFVLNAYLALIIGLSLGGLFTLILGYLIYWQHFGLLIKFGSLIVAIVLLLFIAIKRLKK